MIYHYAMMPTIRLIQSSQVLRGQPQRLYGDMLGQRLAHTTPPVVQCTLNPLGEGTTLARARANGYRGGLVGDVGRIVLAETPEALDLQAYCRLVGCPLSAWHWAISTAMLIGIDPTVWRFLPRDVPAAEWQGVEVLAALDAEGTTWRPAS